MNEQPSHPSRPDEASSPPSRQRDRPSVLQGLLILVAVAVSMVLGAVGWAAAADDTPTPQPSASASTPKSDHPGWSRWGGPWAGPSGGGWGSPLFDRGRALHGEVVVAKDGGGTETVLIQRGKLTTVTKSSIAVTSSDGFHRTYAVNDETQVDAGRETTRSLAKGSDVVVSARKSGNALTAVHIIRLGN
jgi:hypothetical protein